MFEILHNIFGAWGGSTHPSVAAAAIYAISVGQRLREQGASDAELADAYKYAFGEGLRWTREETDLYWATHQDRPGNVSEESIDAFDAYVHWVREHKPEINASVMRGDTWIPYRED